MTNFYADGVAMRYRVAATHPPCSNGAESSLQCVLTLNWKCLALKCGPCDNLCPLCKKGVDLKVKVINCTQEEKAAYAVQQADRFS